jgi:hypothetical protein
MSEQIKIENIQCQICYAEMKDNLLVSAESNDKWSLFLCPKKLKEKINELGCQDVATGDTYKRLTENFKELLSCPHYKDKEDKGDE